MQGKGVKVVILWIVIFMVLGYFIMPLLGAYQWISGKPILGYKNIFIVLIIIAIIVFVFQKLKKRGRKN